MDRPLLRVVGLGFSYGSARLFEDLSLQAYPGEVVAVLGDNGSGKSSLLGLISGVLKPSEGTVHLDGIDVTGRQPSAISRRGMRFLPQGAPVFPSLTVSQNLELATRGGDGTVPEMAPLLAALEALRRRKAAVLSAGERQLLALVMVLLRDALVYLLDEPTAALASSLRHLALEAISARCRRARRSVILVEQNRALALSVADTSYQLRLSPRGIAELHKTSDPKEAQHAQV